MNPMKMAASTERLLRAQARAARRSQDSPRVKGFRQVGGGQVELGIRMSADPALTKELESLAPRMQRTFARRATRAALNILKRIAVPLYARHRTSRPRAHLDESLTVVTRSYARNGVSWGALGFKMPGAFKTQHGEYDAAGWRAHFFEDGFTATGGIRHGLGAGNLRDARGRFDRGPGGSRRSAVRAAVRSGAGRWVPGRNYLPIVKRMGEPLMVQQYQRALRELLRSGGKRMGRTPRSLLRATSPNAVIRGARR